MISVAPVITVDGPSSSGKSTLCKAIVKTLQWHFLDSGAIYRVLALLAQYHRVDLTSEEELTLLATYLDVCFVSSEGDFRIILEGKDVSNEIRTQYIDNVASQIAEFPCVRKALLHYQREFRKIPGLVADGRDMGVVVFPDASVKIFLDASLEERANRRMLQLQKKGFSINLRSLISEIEKRDDRDRNRTAAPLVLAEGALVLDSTNLTIEQVIGKALQYVNKKLNLT